MSAMKEAFATAIDRLVTDQGSDDGELAWELAQQGVIVPLDLDGALWARHGIVYNSTDKELLA
jgi:hypothetical protein